MNLTDEMIEEIWERHPAVFGNVGISYYFTSDNAIAFARAVLKEAGVEELEQDAERYRWLRSQHEAQENHSDTEGFSWTEPVACAFTVFCPTYDECLEPVGCFPGELDAAIDEAMKAK